MFAWKRRFSELSREVIDVNDPGRKVLLFTLGCKINQYDTNAMASALKGCGHDLTQTVSEADVIVINTCTVTGRTDYKGRQLIRKAIHQNPSAVMIVTGCYAQVQAERIAEIRGVDYILGNAEKADIASWISRCVKQEAPRIHAGALSEVLSLGLDSLDVHSGTTRAFLKVQDGCNHACSYCIIPRARGRSRSLPPVLVKEKVALLVQKGFQEVVLCGIHLGVYGQDLHPPVSLLDVLSDLEETAEIPRIRISSIEPNELTEELLVLFARARRLCHHFHLPLQSGDPAILRAMNRPYGPDDFAGLVRRIDQRMPEAAIGVDLIAGFPGEGEAAFRNTFRLLEDLPITYFHVFPYSPRPGTAAARFPDPVEPETIEKRAGALREMGMNKRTAFYRRFLNKELEVLVETKRDGRTGMLKGVSRNYVPVFFEGPDRLQRSLVPVKVQDVRGKEVFGALGEAGLKKGAQAGHLDNLEGSDKLEGQDGIESFVRKREESQARPLVRE